jgi:hypothetical protein
MTADGYKDSSLYSGVKFMIVLMHVYLSFLHGFPGFDG